MIGTFLMVSKCSITKQSLGKIVLRAPAAGAKTWCVYVYYRQDAAKRQTAGIKFTHRPKIRFFDPQGPLVAPIHVKLSTADGHLSRLGCAKFHPNRRRGVGMRPQNIKNFHFFGKESSRRGESLDRFLKF